MPNGYSRRAVLMQIAATGVTATAPRHAFAAYDDRPWSFLTDDEARWLAAVCDVFIPQDEYPSASQAGVVDYIDLQLASGYGQGDGLYLEPPFAQGTPQQGWQVPMTPSGLIRRGIAGARGRADAEVTTLDPAGREAFVQALSEETGMLGDVPAPQFFSELRSLTNEGYFADPIYLGNHDYAGWRMVGFPGAHAYYLGRVDDASRSPRQPPMGIAHQAGRSATAPRLIGQKG